MTCACVPELLATVGALCDECANHECDPTCFDGEHEFRLGAEGECMVCGFYPHTPTGEMIGPWAS